MAKIKVEISGKVHGPKNSLLDFIAWCKQGPQRAQVKNVAVEWLDESEDLDQKNESSALPAPSFLIVN